MKRKKTTDELIKIIISKQFDNIRLWIAGGCTHIQEIQIGLLQCKQDRLQTVWIWFGYLQPFREFVVRKRNWLSKGQGGDTLECAQYDEKKQHTHSLGVFRG